MDFTLSNGPLASAEMANRQPAVPTLRVVPPEVTPAPPPPPGPLPEWWLDNHPGEGQEDWEQWVYDFPGKQRLRTRGSCPPILMDDDVPDPPLDLPLTVGGIGGAADWTTPQEGDSPAVLAWRRDLRVILDKKHAESLERTAEWEAEAATRQAVEMATATVTGEGKGLGPMLEGRIAKQVTDKLVAIEVQRRVEELRNSQAGPIRWRKLSDVADDAAPVSWLVRGLWPHPMFGQLAGAEKTLKSYLAQLLALSVASGRNFMGVLPVRQQGPVAVYVGEGSESLWWRRAVHLGRGMGLTEDDIRALPIEITDQVARVTSRRFQEGLDAQLRRKPVLVILDPLYAYQGSAVNAANLHEAAEVLTALSGPTQAAGASLVVVNHFTKAGKSDLSLGSITQAGSREWAGAWCLVKHVTPPDLDAQVFDLELAVGSREGNGTSYLAHIDLTPLDEETLRHTGEPSWSLVRPAASPKVSASDAVIKYVAHFGMAGYEHRPSARDIEDAVSTQHGHLTRGDARAAIKTLTDAGQLVCQKGPHAERDTVVTRPVYYLAAELITEDGRF